MYMLILNFTYPLRFLRVPLGVRVPPVEYHWSRQSIVCLTATKFEPFILSVLNFALTSVANIDIFMISYDCCFLHA
jgi:hypothetical protein